MAITATITSALTIRMNKHSMELVKKEVESSALYKLTNHLSDAYDNEDIANITTKTISQIFSTNIGFFCFDNNEMPENFFELEV